MPGLERDSFGLVGREPPKPFGELAEECWVAGHIGHTNAPRARFLCELLHTLGEGGRPRPAMGNRSLLPGPRLGRLMEIVTDYRRRAFEVEKLAGTAATMDQRRRILEIALTWTSLADQREKLIREGRLRPTARTERG